jgi:hypothetical protein
MVEVRVELRLAATVARYHRLTGIDEKGSCARTLDVASPAISCHSTQVGVFRWGAGDD